MAWKKYLFCLRCSARTELVVERCPSCNSLDLSSRDPVGEVGTRTKNRRYGRFNYESGSPQDIQDDPRKAEIYQQWSRGVLIKRVDQS